MVGAAAGDGVADVVEAGLNHSRVCVQLPTSAVNAALPAFAAARRAAAPSCCGAGRAAIDRYVLPVGCTAENPPHDTAAN